MKKNFSFLCGLASLLIAVPALHAQADYTASRSSTIEAGAGAMYLNNDYTDRANYGVTAWADYDFKKYFGAQLEGHLGGIISPDDIGENSILIGPKVTYHRRKLELYGKLMFGRATISNQNYNTSSSFNIYAFGGGADYRIARKFKVRLDGEEQKWGDFEPNTLSPLAISVGLLYIIR